MTKKSRARADSSDNQAEDYREKMTQPPRGPGDAHPAAVSQFYFSEQASLGDYLLLETIGAGGMGQVFKAQHQRMERIVALKILSTSMAFDDTAIRRFHREVKAAAKLFHPNIVTAFDAGEQDGMHYLVMEYVDGCTFTKLVEQGGPLASQAAVGYILQAARGLKYAHSVDVVHRDIKPSNLMLNSDGVVKVLDMGLARIQDDPTTTAVASMNRLTQSGAIMGTLGFMSPEQISNASRADQRTDIYSLGCTLYFLLTGRAVFGGDMIETVMGHVKKPVPALRASRDDVPEALEVIYQRMLVKDPDQRYQTMDEVIADLERCRFDRPSDSEVSRVQAIVSRPRPSSEAAQDTVFAGGEESSTVSPNTPAVGIAFGTISSTIARIDDAGRPALLANADGETSLPSMVLIDSCSSADFGDVADLGNALESMLGEDSRIVVGKQVLQAGPAQRKQAAWAFKRELGREVLHSFSDGSAYPPEVLSALLLRRLADDARKQIGDFQHVVMAVPACFDDTQRKAMQDAAAIAGLKVTGLISDPLAAALAFADQQRLFQPDSARSDPRIALVFDLGGGVFDVSAVEISDSRISALATDGDPALGGYDWDRRLMDWVADRFKQEHRLDPRQDAAIALRLWRKCEVAKRALSSREEVDMVFDFRKKSSHFRITRDTLGQLTRDLREQTGKLTLRVLKASGLAWSQIDAILLVGGGSQMPLVHDMLRKLSAQQPQILHVENENVAKGAALYAAVRSDRTRSHFEVEITEVNSRQLGVVGVDKRTKEKRHAAIIPRNASLPVTVQQAFKTRKDGQKSLTIQIIQGNSDSPDECTSIGKLSIVGLPPELPANSPINVEFRMGANGRLHLSVDTEQLPSAKTMFTRTTGNSPQQLNSWREWLDTMLLCGQIASP
ncbi:MAG: Hsp70 family protein [Pirellulaceae bacterium]